MYFIHRRIWRMLSCLAAILSAAGLVGCSPAELPDTPSITSVTQATTLPIAQPKINPILQTQVDLKIQQLANPTPERLTLLQKSGANIENFNIQRVYIHLAQVLTAGQTAELASLGITPYPDSWIPPVGDFKSGYILAKTPVDKLNALAALDYVIKINTAEKQLFPQIDTPQGEVK